RHTRFSRDWSSDVCSSDLARLHPRHADMPYRNLLVLVTARLWATTHDETEAYPDAAAFEADLALVADSLQANGGEHAGGFAVWQIGRASCRERVGIAGVGV